jgi:protein MPAN
VVTGSFCICIVSLSYHIIYFLSSFPGAVAGTGILGVSKAMGYGNYKPLMTALREDFTEEERNNLYERLWGRLSAFVVCPLNQAMAYSALTELRKTVEENPEVMENIRNELKETLSKKNMILA